MCDTKTGGAGFHPVDGVAIALTTMLRGSPGYAAGVVWALVAIAIGASARDSTVLSATAALAAAAVVVAAAVALGRRRSASI